jgi:hypothetical protein
MSELKPGKGFHGTVTSEVLNFLADAINDVREAYVDGGGTELVDEGEAFKVLNLVTGFSSGWTSTKDKFGKKLYREIDWQGGSYRVTVVLNSHGELKIDIRQWYNPDEA